MKFYPSQQLELPTGAISYFHNGTSSPTKALCLHGWLDNRASFLPMMPYLQAIECVAVDLAGHGQSDHREPNSLIPYIDYVRDIKLIMDALGWDSCHLIGHSLGGAIGLLAACSFKEQIRSLTMIDILHPSYNLPQAAPALLQKSLNQFAKWDKSRQKIFPTLKHAINARLKASPFSQSPETIALIMQYATEKVATGYRMRSDPRLNFRSPIMFDRAQTNAFVQAMEQPVLAIIASEGILKDRDDVEPTLALFNRVQVEHIKGNHHIHMEQAKLVADTCLDFIAKIDNAPAPEHP